MKKTVYLKDFKREFENYGREDDFSEQGKIALYNYLVELEEDAGVEFELDIIALCCEFTEYANLEELKENYDIEDIEELQQNTIVIIIDEESFIIQDF